MKPEDHEAGPEHVGFDLDVLAEAEKDQGHHDPQRQPTPRPACRVDKREAGGYITPIDCVGDFATFVSRIRQDPTIDNGLNIWVVSDNLRKGAALNAVAIALFFLTVLASLIRGSFQAETEPTFLLKQFSK